MLFLYGQNDRQNGNKLDMTSRVKKPAVRKKRKTKNQFQPGHTLSKGKGRPKLSDEERELVLKTRTEFKIMLDKYMVSSEEELEALIERKDIPAIDAMVIRSLINHLRSGDQSGINWFLDHSLGKVKETKHIEFSGNVSAGQKIDLDKLSKEDLIAYRKLVEKSNGE